MQPPNINEYENRRKALLSGDYDEEALAYTAQAQGVSVAVVRIVLHTLDKIEKANPDEASYGEMSKLLEIPAETLLAIVVGYVMCAAGWLED